MTTAGSSILVDTNVLLTATSPKRALHRQALTVLNEWPSEGIHLLTSGQILREYLVVASRSVEVNGLGLSIRESLENVKALGGRLLLLEETKTTSEWLTRLAGELECAGKTLHDANVVATLLTHKEKRLVTANAKDFVRFEPLIEVVDLAGVARI